MQPIMFYSMKSSWNSLNENAVVLLDLSLFKQYVKSHVTYDHLSTFPELSEMGLTDFV